jgi:hypothetical protein
MSFIAPTSWRFYVGSFVSNDAAGLAAARNIPELQAAVATACAAGPSFNPAACAYLAQTLGRVQTQRNCYSGAPQVVGGNPATWGPPLAAAKTAAPTSLAALGGVLAATNAVATGVPNAALAALNQPLSNAVGCGGGGTPGTPTGSGAVAPTSLAALKTPLTNLPWATCHDTCDSLDCQIGGFCGGGSVLAAVNTPASSLGCPPMTTPCSNFYCLYNNLCPSQQGW